MNQTRTSLTATRFEEPDRQWAISPHQPARGSKRPQNVAASERWVSAIGGSALVLWGIPRGGVGGIVAGLLGGALVYRGATGHCSVYEALGVNTQDHNPRTAIPAQQGVKIERSIAVNRSPPELYAVWRDFANLPKLMRHLESVEQTNSQQSRWIAKAPLGQCLEWNAEIITDREPDVIAWRSLDGGDVDTAGSVRFTPLGGLRGTAVSISLKYDPPGGKAGAKIASLFGQGLEQELDEDLHRFKSFMEAGEFPTVDGQPHG